ncbi:MJ0570-related uncharacterized domain-containing protein [Haladaptatus litoreus]|uniref:MJ0570-related uncharacterized domain-containing protein n=1 Tax=Haladaptatus litoreus TaxID=553468 RepID=A0A1N7EY21_9EURY|nr:diphthine--ammonia ligase [Haladaptatus litoreus]SIR92805.1 MJ0570-related uncharacterized domain-containing protein [Haladaptatus litoreus]
MKRFCSWGGGKDSYLAWVRASEADSPLPLLTMVVSGNDSTHQSYGEVVQRQAMALEIPLVSESVSWESYEDRFKDTVGELGADFGVFGTIDVEEHRSWVKSTCSTLDVTPKFPLWGEDPVDLYYEILDRGWEVRIVKLDATRIDERWLGEPLDTDFLEFLLDNSVHPMGEHGEYQTLVLDGPGFNRRVPVEITGSSSLGDYRIAQLDVGEVGENR